MDWIEQILFLFDMYNYPYIFNCNELQFEIPWEYIIDFHHRIGVYTDLIYTYPIDEVFWKNYQAEVEKLCK